VTADFIGCDGDEVGLTLNATMGMNLLASGVDLEAGDEVLMTDREHGGGRCGWDVKARRHGTVVKEVRIPEVVSDPDDIVKVFEAAITPRTKVVTFPHITSGRGIVLPARRPLRNRRPGGHHAPGRALEAQAHSCARGAVGPAVVSHLQ
jgi:isopenicillin-N epimerase